MARYFFNLYDDLIIHDEDGAVFDSTDEAKAYAVRNARDVACGQVMQGYLALDHRIEITDHHGNVLATVRFDDAIRVTPCGLVSA